MDYTNSGAPRRKLTDILDGGADRLREQWDRTEAAADFGPLPARTYECHVQTVELFTARTGTPGAKIRFRVCEGEHAGRCVFSDCWLTPAALPQTKRDLVKLGIVRLEQLESGAIPPARIRCRVRVGLRTDDAGEQFNRVRGFDVLGVDEPEADPFAPSDAPDNAPEAEAESGGSGDSSFDFGANAGEPNTDKPAGNAS